MLKPQPHITAQTTQSELEILFSKYQTLSCIKQEFIDAGFPAEFTRHGIDIEFGLEAMTHIVLLKRATVGTLGGILLKHFLDRAEPAQACVDALYQLLETGFLAWHNPSRCFVVKYNITDDVAASLDLYQYPLPMIEKPEEVTHNRQTGYQTIRGSLILKDKHTDDDICLDHVNRMNAVPLRLNMDTVAFVRNQWKNLDKRKPDETPQDFEERRRAFAKYDHVSRDVVDAIALQDDHFWLTHKYDFRGRTYCQGYHVNYQGNDWNKACIEFAEGEYIDE